MIERPVNTVTWLRDEAPVSLWDDTEVACRAVAGADGWASDPAEGISAYRALRAIAEEILATSDLEKMLERCGLLAQRLLRADACSIALLDETSGHFVPLLTMLIPLPPEQGQRGIFWVGRIHGEPFTPEEQGLAGTLSALVALGVRATGLAEG